MVARRSAARTCGRIGPASGAGCTRSAAQERPHPGAAHARGTPARAAASAILERPPYPARKVIGEHRRVTNPPPLFGTCLRAARTTGPVCRAAAGDEPPPYFCRTARTAFAAAAKTLGICASARQEKAMRRSVLPREMVPTP